MYIDEDCDCPFCCDARERRDNIAEVGINNSIIGIALHDGKAGDLINVRLTT